MGEHGENLGVGLNWIGSLGRGQNVRIVRCCKSGIL